jgi:hypothetical protein
MVAALRHFQPPVSNAHNARMELRFGGCSKQGLLMKRPPNFIDAQSATTLGATTPSRRTTGHNIYHYHLVRDIIFNASRDQAFFLQSESKWEVAWSSIISNDAIFLKSG